MELRANFSERPERPLDCLSRSLAAGPDLSALATAREQIVPSRDSIDKK